MGGLSVQAEMEAEQGDVLQVLLQPLRREPVSIEAIVWHARRMRELQSGKTSYRLGLVLSEASDDFAELLDLPGRTAKSSAPETKIDTEPSTERPSAQEPSPPKPAPTPMPEPERYRVRVKLDGSNRTRSILVFAAAADEARKNALAETGEDWLVLEIEPA